MCALFFATDFHFTVSKSGRCQTIIATYRFLINFIFRCREKSCKTHQKNPTFLQPIQIKEVNISLGIYTYSAKGKKSINSIVMGIGRDGSVMLMATEHSK